MSGDDERPARINRLDYLPVGGGCAEQIPLVRRSFRSDSSAVVVVVVARTKRIRTNRMDAMQPTGGPLPGCLCASLART